jgi:hypothetical protein
MDSKYDRLAEQCASETKARDPAINAVLMAVQFQRHVYLPVPVKAFISDPGGGALLKSYDRLFGWWSSVSQRKSIAERDLHAFNRSANDRLRLATCTHVVWRRGCESFSDHTYTKGFCCQPSNIG